MSFTVMQATDLDQATTIYNQLTESQEPKVQSEQWAIMAESQSKVFTIDTVAPTKPVALTPVGNINTTTRVPIGFGALMALRVRNMLNL